MAYYLIQLTYKLRNGDEVQLDLNNIEATDQADAIGKVPEILGRADEMKHPLLELIKKDSPNPVPAKIDVRPVPPPPAVREGRFLLQHSQEVADGWVVTDVDYKVVVRFREHHFNDSQKITYLTDAPKDYLVRARIMREMGDWLGEHHKEILV